MMNGLTSILNKSIHYEKLKGREQILIGLLKSHLEIFEAKFESNEDEFNYEQRDTYLISAMYLQGLEHSKERQGYINRILAKKDELPFN